MAISRFKKTASEIRQDATIKKWKKITDKKKKIKAKPKSDVESPSELNGMNYPAFLQSRYWAKVRKLILIRDNNMCRICKSTSNLNIHHDTYKHWKKELKHLDDLMVLCRPCHKEHHYAQD